MKNNVIYTVIIATIIMVSIAFFLRWKMLGDKEISDELNDNSGIENTLYIEPVEEKNEIINENVRTTYENASKVFVELVERTTVEDESGNSSTNYDRYIVSEVDLKAGSDWTEDCHDALEAESIDGNVNASIPFNEGFNISYEGLNGWQLYKEVLRQNGFDGDLSDVTFDSDVYKNTGQKTYWLNENCSVITNLLSGENYDELLESKVTYSLDSEDIPDSFNAEVVYTSGNNKITKNLFVQVSVVYCGEEDVDESI